MHRAFREGGRQAINKVMRQSPAIFLKLLVLLVPRELEVTHTNSLKSMSDEALEEGIAAIQAMLEKRAAGVVDVTPTPETSELGSRCEALRPSQGGLHYGHGTVRGGLAC